jgi:ferredoxin
MGSAADGGNIRQGWLGFDGRVFLEDSEHATFSRRAPVRYAYRGMHPDRCEVCGSTEAPRQWAHKIPFGRGVLVYKLTPDYLDSPGNLVSACRAVCNSGVEFSHLQILRVLDSLK